MKPTVNKILVLTLSLFAFTAFQNCAKVNFSSKNPLMTKAGLTSEPPVVVGDGGGEQASGGMIYVCVLKGPGNSHVLQYSSENHLYNDTSKNQTVCTTERGCMEIASQIFDVDHVKDESGRCAHANSVIQIDEAGLQDLVNSQTQI